MRRITCEPCGQKWQLDPEDAEQGFTMRKVAGIAKTPDDLHIRVNEKRIDLPQMLCDDCNKDLPNGTPIIAITMSRRREIPEWESEYMQAGH